MHESNGGVAEEASTAAARGDGSPPALPDTAVGLLLADMAADSSAPADSSAKVVRSSGEPSLAGEPVLPADRSGASAAGGSQSLGTANPATLGNALDGGSSLLPDSGPALSPGDRAAALKLRGSSLVFGEGTKDTAALAQNEVQE